MKKIILCLMLVFILGCFGSVSADVSIDTYNDGDYDMEPDIISCTNTENYSNAVYSLSVETYVSNSDIERYPVIEQNSSSGVFDISGLFPWEEKTYYINVTYINLDNTSLRVYDEKYIYYKSDADKDLSIRFEDFRPSNLDYYAGYLMEEALGFSVTANDTDLDLYMAGAYYDAENHEWDIFDVEDSDPGQHLDDMTDWSRNYRFNFLEDEGYIEIKRFMVDISGFLNERDAVMFCVGVNNSEYGMDDITVTNDDTCIPTRFSYDGNNLEFNHDLTNDYVGVYVYFEVSDGGEVIWYGGETDPTDINSQLEMYGDNIGISWMPLFIAMILIFICVMVPLGYAIRMDVDIPNIGYSLCATVGTFLSFVLGLLSLWMLVFICAIAFFATLITNRETLQRAVNFMEERRQRLPRLRTSLAGETLRAGVKTPSKAKKYIKEQYGEWKNQPRRVIDKDKRVKRDIPGTLAGFFSSGRKRIARAKTRSGKPKTDYSQGYAKKMKRLGYRMKGKYWVRD